MEAKEQDSIYRPKDDELVSRINAYHTVMKEKRNIELSLDLFKDKEWAERLGSTQELEQAHKVISTSLEKAIMSFSDSDLKKVSEQKLLDDTQLHEMRINQAKAKLGTLRQSQDSDEKKHGKSI
ncbi:hypothetical protein N473_10555 [Pseudoalteromonas luteoviolacea CPMOR-1]|uniref:Uncharacterized protein n=1 Tax=Pseudoalteromonas luteoviolacea CPMOR-1 TaxID=1365248 RepID=A0A162CD98_9GAMM|nr:hypothetical protein [Pseudoalteromonas luteoviolacea]KZN66001.1 hypothetical protein N473_10555 [Pseudoalteromonas luteoviolacea CPMOR-1]